MYNNFILTIDRSESHASPIIIKNQNKFIVHTMMNSHKYNITFTTHKTQVDVYHV